MALVEHESLALSLPDVDPRLREKARGEGRVRGITLQIYREALAQPTRAGATLRRGFREARALHSRERRFASDTVYALIRHAALLDHISGTAEPEARYDLWLDLLDGKDPAPFAAQLPDDPVARFAILANIPAEAAALWVDQFGDDALGLLHASNRHPTPHLRANRNGQKAVLAALAEANIGAQPGPWSPHAIRTDGGNIAGLPGYRSGAFELQDEGSQLLAELVQPRNGQHILDFCAGAGGKSLALADWAPKAILTASDIRPGPLNELDKRARRAKRRVTLRQLHKDGSLPKPLAEQRFHAVLVDAPCSGSGVWRRHPEYRFRASDSLTLPELQGQILARAAQLVRDGGRLVYGTCSLLEPENEGVVAAFLAKHPEWQVVPLDQVLGDRSQALGGDMLRLRPDTHGTDGFFGAVLERR